MDISSVDSLSTDTWIGGNYTIYKFNVYDSSDNTPVNLTIFQELKWVLFRYSDPDNPVLNLRGQVGDPNNQFQVTIESSYTENLSGLFVQQPILIDGYGNEFRPSQGLINIVPRGNELNSVFTQKRA